MVHDPDTDCMGTVGSPQLTKRLADLRMAFLVEEVDASSLKLSELADTMDHECLDSCKVCLMLVGQWPLGSLSYFAYRSFECSWTVSRYAV